MLFWGNGVLQKPEKNPPQSPREQRQNTKDDDSGKKNDPPNQTASEATKKFE